MPRINIAHKKQTKLNDCWYACIQMIKTHKANGIKCKPIGTGVTAHREAGAARGGFWGHALGKSDTEFNKIMSDNNIRVLGFADMTSLNTIQQCIDIYGPLIVGGDFGKIARIRGTNKWLMTGFGHYIVLAGTEATNNILYIHDPWRSHGTEMPFATFDQQVWKGNDQTVIANKLG